MYFLEEMSSWRTHKPSPRLSPFDGFFFMGNPLPFPVTFPRGRSAGTSRFFKGKKTRVIFQTKKYKPWQSCAINSSPRDLSIETVPLP